MGKIYYSLQSNNQLTNALLPNLIESLSTCTLVWALGIYTLIFTGVLACGTLIKVTAGNAIRIQCVSSRAGAPVWSLCILACELARGRSLLTLVDINAAGYRVVWFVTFVTDAAVRAHCVDTLAVATEVRQLALIYVQAINREASLHTYLIILWSASAWTMFTHGPPSQSHGAAAVSFRHLQHSPILRQCFLTYILKTSITNASFYLTEY